MLEKDRPDSASTDHAAMVAYWSMVTAILGGVTTMRAAGENYLPKFEAESDKSYQERKKHAKFTNVFRDILENLAQKPFSKTVAVSDAAPDAIREFAEDVDGEGNNLHTFAGETFFNGIAYAVDWILVDYTHAPEGAGTVAEEREAGVRPYWCHYPAESVLAAHSAKIGGREEFVHVRLKEAETVREGFKEVKKDRVRILDREALDGGGYGPATWAVWEKQQGTSAQEDEWALIDEGQISIGVIPLVPFMTGRRKGKTWVFQPPMRDAAELQIEHYQQENGLKNAKNLTAFPMLAGNGVDPEVGEDGQPVPLIVGPSTVLYTGSSAEGSPGSWQFVEPSATSLRFLAEDIKDTAKELRELGRQPLTAQSGNLTVVTTAFAAQKGNSAIQAWALNLKGALECALGFTAMWLRIEATDISVTINTDFDIGLGDDDTFDKVLELYRDGSVSREHVIHEAKRRGIIDKDYDPEADLEAIIQEIEDRNRDP